MSKAKRKRRASKAWQAELPGAEITLRACRSGKMQASVRPKGAKPLPQSKWPAKRGKLVLYIADIEQEQITLFEFGDYEIRTGVITDAWEYAGGIGCRIVSNGQAQLRSQSDVRPATDKGRALLLQRLAGRAQMRAEQAMIMVGYLQSAAFGRIQTAYRLAGEGAKWWHSGNPKPRVRKADVLSGKTSRKASGRSGKGRKSTSSATS